jgi:hypothetical protein
MLAANIFRTSSMKVLANGHAPMLRGSSWHHTRWQCL